MNILAPAPIVIGFTGSGGVGKSTIARAIGIQLAMQRPPDQSEEMPAILHIAEPLKEMLAVLYRYAGRKETEIRRALNGDLKRRADPLFDGKSPTHAMQTLGTEWGRDLIQSDLWLDIWKTRARAALDRGTVVINDSVRFENEAAAIRELGGVVVGLYGRAGDLAADHVSEAGIDADVIVSNDGTAIETAAAAVLVAIRDYYAMMADAFARHG